MLSNLGIVDLALLGVIAFSALMGLFRGITHQIISIVFMVAGFILAKAYAADMVPMNAKGVVNTAYYGLSFAGIFFTVVLVGIILRFIVTRFINFTPLAIVDKFFGAGFGGLKGYLAGMVLVFGCQFTPLADTEYWHQSKLMPYYEQGINYVSKLLGEADVDLNVKMPTADDIRKVIPKEFITY